MTDEEKSAFRRGLLFAHGWMIRRFATDNREAARQLVLLAGELFDDAFRQEGVDIHIEHIGTCEEQV